MEVVLTDLKNKPSLDSLRRNSFYHIFYNGQTLDELFLAAIPIENVEKISHTLSIIRMAYGSGDMGLSSHLGNISVKTVIDILSEFLDYLRLTLNTYGFTIFYSWQSDTLTLANRNFIEKALEKAIKAANNELKLPLKLDKDTTNREGSPDIVRTILEKIDNCLLFVADISIVGKIIIGEKKEEKYTPNANVLYELGYTHGVLSENNIVMVFNKSTGTIDNLPFDLRGRRSISYCFDPDAPDEKKKEEKNASVSFEKRNCSYR